MPRRRRGRRGQGGLTQRPNGRWQAQWSRTEGGKRVRESATFTLKSDAEWWLREARRGNTPDDPLLADYLVRWLAGKRRIRASTKALYESHIRVHITPGLGGFRLSELQRRHIEAFIDTLNLSPGTVGLIVTTLRSALNQAVRDGELQDNPARSVERPEVIRKPVAAMTEDGRDAIVEAVTGTWLEYVIRFLVGSGCRIGEACALNQGDVHDGFVSLRRPKTVPRAARVSEDAMEALNEAIRRAPRRGKDEPVFFGPRTGDRLTRSVVTHALPRILEQGGTDPLRPHRLRHAAATLMVAAGWSIRVVAEQLGNTERVTAETYAHVAPEVQAAAVAALNVRRR